MEPRFLLHTKDNYDSLSQNSEFNFAKSHALRLFQANAIYTFIPKNACSSLRVSLALQNGLIESIEDFNWIHSNNHTFSASLADIACADYTFVVLRCPYRRLASAFLDKLVNRDIDAWLLHNELQRKISIEDLTFSKFVELVQDKEIRESNIHWRKQSDFLIYKRYDDYFSLEKFSTCVTTVRDKISLKLIDARELTKHGSDQFESLDMKQDFSKVSAFDLLVLKSQGKLPHVKSLYTNNLKRLVTKTYQDDLDLYISHFGKEKLLFNPTDWQSA